MFSQMIWWGCSFLEALILLRGFRTGILAKYPFFYVQLTLVFIVGLAQYAVFVIIPASYAKAYWASQLLTMFAACGIILEILKHALSQHSYLRTFAKTIRFVLFAGIFCFAMGYLMISGIWRADMTNIFFERGFRAFQAILLLTILGGIFFYRIPIGRNVKGIFLGYGVYVATSLIALSLRLYKGLMFDSNWYFLQPLSYTISVIIWAFSLWTYHPDPALLEETQLVTDDASFRSKSNNMMFGTWSSVSEVIRP